MRLSSEQTEEFMSERHSYSDEMIGKQEFEKGIHVRAQYSPHFPICKAIIIAVDSDIGKINALFDTLDEIRKSEVSLLYPVKQPNFIFFILFDFFEYNNSV